MTLANSKIDLKQNWTELEYVAFDTETSGPYPIESEIIELGAIKWKNGEIVDRFQTLLKPSKPLQSDNIRIHGITNEMVQEAPDMKSKISEFKMFIENSVLIAHHAPFDLGFLTIDFEKNNLNFPNTVNLCTSLLSRALLHTTNHKLQTLIKELNLIGGAAHRAYDDAYACFQVFQKCVEKLGTNVNLEKLLQIQIKNLDWKNYSVNMFADQKIKTLVQKCWQQKPINIVYASGQTKSKPRMITPMGIVRNPDGDYLHAFCHIDQTRKRFYLDKITDFDLT